MTAVTVECDEKSMVDKPREWRHSLLPHKAGSNDVGCYSGPLRLSLCRNSSRASIIFNRIRCREFHALWWADGPWPLRAGFLEKRGKGRTPGYSVGC